jgi:putative endonuclease
MPPPPQAPTGGIPLLLHRLRLALDRRPASRGESAAARHLKHHRYRILGRNVRLAGGEIDLLALTPDGTTLVVVEVKAASAGAIGPAPELRVGSAKQRQLLHLAAAAARRPDARGKRIRIDILGVTLPATRRGKPQVRHHVGAVQSRL